MASITDRVGDVGEYLREQREHARLSLRQLASLAGVSNPYLSQVERGLRKPSAEVLQQLARGLRISAEALYVRAGILDPEEHAGVEVAVATDPHLTDRQRRVLLDIYESFRAENARIEHSRHPETLTDAVPPTPTTPPVAAGAPGPGTTPRPARARRTAAERPAKAPVARRSTASGAGAGDAAASGAEAPAERAAAGTVAGARRTSRPRSQNPSGGEAR